MDEKPDKQVILDRIAKVGGRAEEGGDADRDPNSRGVDRDSSPRYWPGLERNGPRKSSVNYDFGADAEIMREDCNRDAERKLRFVLRPFDQIIPGSAPPFLVRDIIPQRGLAVIWGPPKCGKTFFTLDLVMHIALGREYRGRRVKRGSVVYCAFEGGDGIARRIAAFRQQRLTPYTGDCPFWLMSGSLALVRDHRELIRSIRAQLVDTPPPACVVLDTLNRSLSESESSDEDMSAYVQAADNLREAFEATVIFVHHCGKDDTRPRGHTSLTGAVDAQIACKKQEDGTSQAVVEYMKDGLADCVVAFQLEQVSVGIDEDGEPITSCVVVPVDRGDVQAPRKRPVKLSPAEKVAFDALLADGIASFGIVLPPASGVPDGGSAGSPSSSGESELSSAGSAKATSRTPAEKRSLAQ